MAPPRNRRPGYDRKAQYGLFVSYIFALGGAMIGLLLVATAIFDPSGFSALRALGAEITRPISASTRKVVTSIGSVDEALSAYLRAGSQNAALRREVDANRMKLIEAGAIRQENIRLKALLKLNADDRDVVANGHLISSTASSARRVARLDIGSNSGVQPGMPVRAPEGLIGRVVAVSPNTADVLLLLDAGNVVPVRRLKDNVPGIARGMGDGSIELRALNSERNPFVPGDVLITSGIGGLYRPNIPVAIVARTAADRAIAIPMANPARVELVVVQQPFRALPVPAPAPAEAESATDALAQPQ
jgi:rod shape-determining protein MreC